ncbi:hypothetical protein AM593_06313, partial [Mytilus galloprovincialis]
MLSVTDVYKKNIARTGDANSNLLSITFLDITSTELLEEIFNLEENFKQSKDDFNHNKQQTENLQSVIATVNHKEMNHTATSDPEPELSVRSLEQENQNLKDQQTFSNIKMG